MVDIVYTLTGLPLRNAYRDSYQLVVQPGAALPDVCIQCGGPARGNVVRKEFSDPSFMWYVLPLGLDGLVDLIVRKRYLLDFPICPSCPPDRDVARARLDGYLGVFVGISEPFLDALPPMPPDVAAEKNRSWLQQRLRWLYR